MTDTRAEMSIFDRMHPYRIQVNDTPALQSILYDIDLLPEQITTLINATRMVAFCELFKVLTPDQVDGLFK